MTIEHRAGAAATHLVPGAMDFEPFLRAFFAAADFVAHSRIENLRAATGHGTETSIAQSLERLRESTV